MPHSSGTKACVHPTPRKSNMYDHIRAQIERLATSILCMPGQILTEAPLSDQGADSLDAIEMALMIEEEWGLHIEDEALERLRTLDDYAGFVAAQLGVEAA